MYERGRGVEQSTVKAMQWYQRAAGKGDPDGRARLLALTQGLEYVPTNMALVSFL